MPPPLLPHPQVFQVRARSSGKVYAMKVFFDPACIS
jgi:hypothetical protein